MNSKTRVIILGELLFSFTSFEDWCDTAQRRFRQCGAATHDTICIDARDRICIIGKEFMQARDEGAFPINVYSIR